MFDSWFPFDKFSKRGYHFAYAFQIIGSIVGPCFLAVLDSFLISLMIVAISQFKVLQCALRNLHNDEHAINEGSGGLKSLNVYDQIIELVQHHIRIIEYA